MKQKLRLQHKIGRNLPRTKVVNSFKVVFYDRNEIRQRWTYGHVNRRRQAQDTQTETDVQRQTVADRDRQ
jgi:hypothetical protein